MLPEMDGLELCHLIKTDSNFKKIPVVMLSAKTDAESIRKGFDYKVFNPFSPRSIRYWQFSLFLTSRSSSQMARSGSETAK